jgi:methylaspartate mutase sigma subunit
MTAPEPLRQSEPRPVIITSTASDAHTWNLVYLQLLIEELGHDVVNLGPCAPDDLVLAECLRVQPGMVVVSTANGHGHGDGERLIRKLRGHADLAGTPVVIGGKLGVDGGVGPDGGGHAAGLIAAGFDAVFEDGHGQVAAFQRFLKTIGGGSPPALETGGAEVAR